MSHTPGPWRTYCGDSVVSDNHKSPSGLSEVARCSSGFEDNAANARLIAAAPDLLAGCIDGLDCLETAVRIGGGDPQTHHVCCRMRAAIAKAEVKR